jgi:hypothetical protein
LKPVTENCQTIWGFGGCLLKNVAGVFLLFKAAGTD